MISRRRFVAQGVALAAVFGAGATAGCRRAPTRQGVLAALVRDQVVPQIRALSQLSAQLEQALQKLEATPSSAAIELARLAFRKALIGWQRAQTFRSGPLVESSALLRAAFWPVRGENLERLLGEPTAIDAARVAALGVDSKGLFALERLLWQRPDGAAGSWLEGPSAARARRLASLFAGDVRAHAEAALASMGDGSQFAVRFAAGGQASLTLLITQNVETIESIAVDRLQRALALHEQGRLRVGALQADYCGLSTQIAVVQLEALSALYRGRAGEGVAALVQLSAPALELRIGSILDQAVAALRGLGMPLEQAALQQPERLRSALARVKALELAYKIELASALALTLSLVSGDGD